MSGRDEAANEEFYVGYLERAPAGVARFVRSRVLFVLAVAVAVALILAAAQGPFAVAAFDFGAPRTFEGTVRLVPHPVLEVERPGSLGSAPESSFFFLVAFGKAGADAEVAAFDGQRVRLEATPIYRDESTMLEIVSGSVTPLRAPAAEASRRVSLGRFTLEGEIVDSKCHLGVMKPGERKAHRACAALCIRGGIPPVFLVRGDELPVARLLLVDAAGEPVGERILDYVAEPVEVTGEVEKMGDLWILRADPSALRRLS